MDGSSPNISIPRRVPSTYERTIQCLRNIGNYLRRYRNHSVFQAVHHIFRPVWRRQERNVSVEIEEEIYQALYRIVESIESFQETVQRTTDRELEVNVEIPTLVPPPGSQRAFVDIRLPMNPDSMENGNREVIQIRFLENQNLPETNNTSSDYDNSRIPPIQELDDAFFERLIARWAQFSPSGGQDGEEPLLDENVDEIVLGEGIAGATEEEVERLALVTATNYHTSQICSICLDEFEFNTPIRMLPCEHIFHPNCVRIWLLRNPTCPIDRRSIFEDS